MSTFVAKETKQNAFWILFVFLNGLQIYITGLKSFEDTLFMCAIPLRLNNSYDIGIS
jgi:hypothetical protein